MHITHHRMHLHPPKQSVFAGKPKEKRRQEFEALLLHHLRKHLHKQKIMAAAANKVF